MGLISRLLGNEEYPYKKQHYEQEIDRLERKVSRYEAFAPAWAIHVTYAELMSLSELADKCEQAPQMDIPQEIEERIKEAADSAIEETLDDVEGLGEDGERLEPEEAVREIAKVWADQVDGDEGIVYFSLKEEHKLRSFKNLCDYRHNSEEDTFEYSEDRKEDLDSICDRIDTDDPLRDDEVTAFVSYKDLPLTEESDSNVV